MIIVYDFIIKKKKKKKKKKKNFYWDRVIAEKSKFKNTRNLFKLSLEYPHLSLGFNWILWLRAGYKYNTTIAIRSGRVSDDCPKFFPCCGKGRFKSNRTTTTKSVNVEETVRQAIRASATNEDHNFVS